MKHKLLFLEAMLVLAFITITLNTHGVAAVLNGIAAVIWAINFVLDLVLKP